MGLLATFSLSVNAQQANTIEEFVKKPSYSSAKISPNGEYLAVSVEVGEQDVLVVLDTKTLKQISANRLPNEGSVGSFYWVGANRLMFTATKKFGRFAQPFGTGEWYAVDADGKKQTVLLSYEIRGNTTKWKRVSPGDRFSLLETIPEQGKSVIMQASRYDSATEKSYSEIVELDIYDGRRTVLAKAPKENCSITLDAKNDPRFAVCSENNKDDVKLEDHSELYKRGDDGAWVLINKSKASGKHLPCTARLWMGRYMPLPTIIKNRRHLVIWIKQRVNLNPNFRILSLIYPILLWQQIARPCWVS